MKKLFAISIIGLTCTTAFAGDVVVDLDARVISYQVHPGVTFTTAGDYYLNVWNNSDIPQPVSIVYMHCVDGGGCLQGQDTHTVEPHALWSHQWRTELPGCRYGIGTYQIFAEMDVRVDLTGRHYRTENHNFISST